MLGGVETNVYIAQETSRSQTLFFWRASCEESCSLYDQALSQAVMFLQGVYGFVVMNYNHESMLAHRALAWSAVMLAATAVRSSVPSEQYDVCRNGIAMNTYVQLQLLYSQLGASA